MKIKNIDAYEILDSRGNPTIETKITLENGLQAKASVPSGASTGSRERLELRDEDPERFNGKGVLKACDNIKSKIFPAIKDIEIFDQEKIEKTMLALDGTKNKSNLGANAILSFSLAVCRAAAQTEEKPLWQYIQEKFNFKKSNNWDFPIPMANVINGGKHADSGLDIQEFMLVPSGIKGFFNRIKASAEIYQKIKEILEQSTFHTSVGDEGGFAPQLNANEEALEIIIQAIENSPYQAGKEIKTGIDAAASEFYNESGKVYNLALENGRYDSEDLSQIYQGWVDKYKMELIEDPFSEEDWQGWEEFNKKMSEEIAVIGDDLLVTDKELIEEAINKKACNAVLIKLNQIGSLTETIQAIKTAQQANLKIAVSHRSGETVDDFVSDLAVAVNADYVKFGAVARGERVSKYNRIIEIERDWKNSQ